MRIAIFSDNFYPELSGISDSIIATGLELSKRGHTIEYFVPRYSKKDYDRVGASYKEPDILSKIKINRLFSLPYPTPTLQGRAVIPNIFRGIFIKNNFDIIHTHNFFGAGIDALISAKISKIPIIGTNHTLIESFLNDRLKLVKNILPKYVIKYYNMCDAITTPAAFLAKKMTSEGILSKIEVISNPIEENFNFLKKEKTELKKEFGLHPFTILNAGRLSPEKNVLNLLDAFISIASKIPNADLVFIGQGTLRKKIEDISKKSGLENRIKIMGPFVGEKKEKMYDLFNASDVFVMPSTSEIQSMVVIQAMARGLPILEADTESLSEIVKPEYGFLFKPNNVTEISDLIKMIYDEPKIGLDKGLSGRKNSENFRVKKIADNWEKLYKEVIGKF